MTAGDVIFANARPWITTNRRDLMRITAPLLSLGLAWWLAAVNLPTLVVLGLIVYGLSQIALIIQRRRAREATTMVGRQALVWLAIAVDILFGLLLISQAADLGSAIHPLYLLLIIRSLSSYRRQPLAMVVPFLFGPAYDFFLQFGSASSLAPADPNAEWGMIFGSLGVGAIAIWATAAQQQANTILRQELRAERMGREARIGDLERSANDLRARMRQLHALEEGLRVITSTLSLDEVLTQIVDSTVQMLGAARVHGMVLSLSNTGSFDHRFFMLDDGNGRAWADSLTRRALDQEVPLIIIDAAQDTELADTIPQGMRSVLCVPLFVGEGPAQGALTIVSATPSAFSSSDARHLTALAMQAGIAINNAELHSRLRQQQHLLNSVLRDINDGLVVVDARAKIVLTNPLGAALLEDQIEQQAVRDELLTLAKTIREEGRPTLMRELHFNQSEGEIEQVYQAYASQVHYADDEEPLVAIVLHDITAQKAEEKSRAEFISMVSHELRNPLNSLNGFIKVVLRGQAGALTALQHEFLTIADGQVEQLKSRISELLEYNRVEAGRLVLDPKWNDLSLLVTGTVTRLSLQAEQNGLTLANQVDMSLPECHFDGERIGQVLNNLIENAIKATPPGGTITLRSELYEDEVWVRVYDTGVGIPAEHRDKIFQRYYRAHNRASSKGNHLGLGLAICQQIIVGHHGRIWVESEEGQGSCFTFSLPLVAKEVTVNE